MVYHDNHRSVLPLGQRLRCHRRASPKGWADMDWKAKLVTSAVTICAALVVVSLQGCMSGTSTAPATSIGDKSRSDEESTEKEVRRQPTILRAEVATPPTAELSEEGTKFFSASDFRSANEILPVAGNPQIADLLPVPSLDGPPRNQR